MPTSNSAKKRLRQNIVRRARNRITRSALKTEGRKVREAVAAADVDKAGAALREATKKLDKAAANGVIHKNAAARTKSRLSAVVKNAKGATPTKTVKKPKAKKS